MDIESFTHAEKEILLGSLLHSLHDIDDALELRRHGDLPDTLLKEIDAAENGGSPSAFVLKIVESDRHALWASMWASIGDVHAPQDQLDESSWEKLRTWFDKLEAALGYDKPAGAEVLSP